VPVLLLVRHASAGARGSGPEDLARPLDARGRVQARALPQLLAPHLGSEDDAVVDVRSSPARRCVETVRPLAAALGTDVVVDPALVEGCDVRALHGRIATLSGPTVWSSHGDVIPELLAMLARRGVDLGPAPTCRKGSTWVVEITGGEARSARLLPPPA
jgi:phosphohistidine phosphatase SixA